MGYMVPLRFIRISNKRSDNRQFDVSICATRIIAIMSTEIYQARKLVATERADKTLINGCGLSKAKSVIIMDNGSVISSPLSVRRLMANVEKANTKANSRMDKRMRVFDVYDGEPDEDDEESIDMSSEFEDDYNEDDFE